MLNFNNNLNGMNLSQYMTTVKKSSKSQKYIPKENLELFSTHTSNIHILPTGRKTKIDSETISMMKDLPNELLRQPKGEEEWSF